jgi:DedD protein
MAFFKFRPGANAGTEESANGAETQTVENLRRRARQRLIGATVLVLLAVVGFPMVFDTQPRPVPGDLTLDIPSKSKQPSNLPPEPLKPSESMTAPATSSTSPSAPTEDPKHTLGDKEELVTPTPKTPEITTPLASSPTSPEAKPGVGGKGPTEPKDASAARYVVQFGAFLEEAKVRETRAKLEKAGLKTYTQVIEAKDGKRTRVRVGPFTTRAEAEKVAEKAKALQLTAIILTY